ncbi:deoxyribonuclease-1-like [Dreissena polymorpha]|uniref:Endonuclease/exonuclease/phosphatase domain-containing protein n=1 Tax=Dreissena polymorpha TaxID=45954 RepID=A0A9D4HK15_DREPO|nr:deoxyribonuclease-1-like [Dreissena polymorpha]XP_052246876.1 deoxyribonuclease-1-like [Dreissena polymorpha]KAH3720333.1 hypothetical protein DPMN_063230 [Dreissena polymorpha]
MATLWIWGSVLMCMLFGPVVCRDLRIGAFNIQIFGSTKAARTDVMTILVKIIRRYDLLLIQEIRDKSEGAITQLLNDVNLGQPSELQFSMLISDRLGRSNIKEQYAYFYRPGQGLKPLNWYVFDDGEETDAKTDLFEREPYIATFRSSNTLLKKFTLVGIHIDPDVAIHELNLLHSRVLPKFTGSDVMVLGDLNAGCGYIGVTKWAEVRMKSDPKYAWLIGDDADTTVANSNCAYDRFIVSGKGWNDGIVPESVEVYRYDADNGYIGRIKKELAADVSDHYPIELLLQAGSCESGTCTRSIQYVLDDVTVELTAASVVLSKEELYEIEGIDAYDSSGIIVAHVRVRDGNKSDAVLRNVILNIQKVGRLDGTPVSMTIQPSKRKYGRSQGCVLTIKIPDQNELKAFVEKELSKTNKNYSLV